MEIEGAVKETMGSSQVMRKAFLMVIKLDQYPQFIFCLIYWLFCQTSYFGNIWNPIAFIGKIARAEPVFHFFGEFFSSKTTSIVSAHCVFFEILLRLRFFSCCLRTRMISTQN